MDDALILEDNRLDLEIISSRIPKRYKISVARDCSEFRSYLGNGEAKLYFLDDNVPGIDGICDRHFIDNCELLLQKDAKARIFYTGSTPRPEEENYCEGRGIPIVDKGQIHEIIANYENFIF